MAKRTGMSEGYTNPTSAPDPRFVPPDDETSALAHELGTGSVAEEKDEQQEKIQKTVANLLDDAIDFYEEELEPDQVKATEYYKGEFFGDEKDGRSKVVNTVVRDAVLAVIPSLMRIVYEAENVAEYVPRPKRDASPEQLQLLDAQAKQATEYVRYIVTEDNPGFSIFWDWIMDALVRRLGTVKWWWDETTRKTQTEYTGLTEAEVGMLVSDPEVEIASGSSYQTTPDSPLLFDLTAVHVEREGFARFICVPNEEFVFTPNARSLEDARLVAHVREMATDELVAVLIADGMDADEAEELVEEHKGKKRRIPADDLDAARQFSGLSRKGLGSADEIEDVCLYAEAYVTIAVDDYGDDGLLPERRLFKCVGPDYEITNGDGLGECVDEVPFGPWTPIPEPHTIIGQSFWDLLKDIQRIISQIERGTLDSLAQAITPVTEVVNGMVNMQDFINPEIAGIRRVRAIGQTNNIVHHFVGGDTLPVLTYYGSVIEDRTGRNKGAMGLDADALQSTTKQAAAAILSASQQRIEIIARVFAETALKPLFRGLLRLITKHQDQARMIRLRNQYVQIDPRQWDATMDVQVNVALGAGTPNDKIEILAGLAAKQQELLAQGSPLVSNVELRNTLASMTELSGQKNTEKFWKKWGEHEESQMRQQMAQQPPPPDPTMALVEIEKQKLQIQAMESEKKMELERWKATMQDDRERDKIARDSVLKEHEIEAKYAMEIEDSRIQAQVARDRAAMDADVKREQIQAQKEPKTVNVVRGSGN